MKRKGSRKQSGRHRDFRQRVTAAVMSVLTVLTMTGPSVPALAAPGDQHTVTFAVTNKLGEKMVQAVSDSISGVDACLLVTEADREPTQTELMLIEKFKSLDLPAILAINKIDTLKNKEVLMAQILKYSKLYDFAAIVPVSAHDGDGINELKEALKGFAMEGGHFFEEDALTDQSERNLAAEMIREKILRLTDREIPHGTAVVVEKMRTRDDGSDIMDVDATIYCEKDSHKGIIIGKGGSMLKKISSQARQDMENFFDCKVNLQTWVKVKEDWRNREGLLKSFGFDKSDFD